MLQSLIIMLREGIEASLIVGIILGALARAEASDRGRAVWGGVAAAVVVSFATGAVLFWTVGELAGQAEYLYEAGAITLAIVVLTWMVFWMRTQARTLSSDLRGRVGAAAVGGSALAIATVAFVAVAREGVETALFLFTATESTSVTGSLLGAVTGGAIAITLGVLVYRGTARLDLRRFFTYTSLALFAFAAYLIVSLSEVLEEAGIEGGMGAGLSLAALYTIGVGTLYFRPSVGSRNAAR
jgi:high-affinity iron transporter